jgi:hypothetical protein
VTRAISAAELREHWARMASESGTGLIRRRLPADNVNVFAAHRFPERRSSVLLVVGEDDLAGFVAPKTRHVEVTIRHGEPIDGEVAVSLELLDGDFIDVFSALAADVHDRIRSAVSAAEALSILSSRLRRWQHLLRSFGGGLSPEQQRGLFGELTALLELVTSGVNTRLTIESWTGPSGAPQDWQFPQCDLEVKTIAPGRRDIQISSEYQLQSSAGGEVFLHVIEAGASEAGVSLADLVDHVRLMANDAGVLDDVDDRLLSLGWLDVHRERYVGSVWAVKGEKTFVVGEGFPKLTEANLPPSVTGVRYTVDISAMMVWTESWQIVVATLKDQ